VSNHYQSANRQAWTELNRQGEASTIAYGPSEFARARYWLDPAGWIPWGQVNSVLCLAAGGGQQGPLFASLGLDVAVLDLSGAQLDRDLEAAAEHGLQIEAIEGDMLDLSMLYGRDFDLVYQPISTLYVPDPEAAYREVLRVLRPGGLYRVEHWSPIQMQLSEALPWDGEAYRLTHPQGTGEPLVWSVGDQGSDSDAVTWNYAHTLDQLIGGVCRSGFVIVNFAERDGADLSAEPGSNEHLAAFVPPFFSILARKPVRPR
jgi:SAM-dependent methyltransferase